MIGIILLHPLRNLCARIEVYLMRLFTLSTVLALSMLSICTLSAQQAGDEKQEFGITVGELSGGNPTAVAGPLTIDAGIAVEANFARRFKDMKDVAVYWELDGLVGPLRYVHGTPVTATHEIRSIYVTPGIKVQFTPKEPISPWIAAGGGFAFYNASGTSIAGGPSTAGSANTYAVDFGGGVDFALGKRYLIRGEIRGFYTGNPDFGASTSGGQFNVIIGGGLVWRSTK